MGYLLGTDEAGYGPNLGPLVISATLWHVPAIHALPELASIDLYQLLHPGVTADAPRPTQQKNRSSQVWIADSKRLYKPGAGVRHLECGILGSLRAAHARCDNERSATSGLAIHNGPAIRWMELWHRLAPQAMPAIQRSPWYDRFDESLPIAADVEQIQQTAETLTAAFAAANIRLVAVRSSAIFPQDFNELLDVQGNKSDILSRTTLKLIRQLIDERPQREPVFVQADKHGGRNRYARWIQAEFPDTLVEVHGESRAVSIYRLGQGDERVEMRFQAKGEGFLPAALASMSSKYLRELAMRAFNRFWCQRVDDLKPTAGYPVDARRFHLQIKPMQERLRISDSAVWRRK